MSERRRLPNRRATETFDIERNADGTASGPLGVALDLVAANDEAGSHG